MVCIVVTALQFNPLKTMPAHSLQKTKVSLNLEWLINVSTNQPESSWVHFSDILKWHNHIHQTKICAYIMIENEILQKHKVKLCQTMLRPAIKDMAKLHKYITTILKVNYKDWRISINSTYAARVCTSPLRRAEFSSCGSGKFQRNSIYCCLKGYILGHTGAWKRMLWEANCNFGISC